MNEISNELIHVRVAGKAEDFLSLAVRGSDGRIAITAPAFDIDGRRRQAVLTGLTAACPPSRRSPVSHGRARCCARRLNDLRSACYLARRERAGVLSPAILHDPPGCHSAAPQSPQKPLQIRRIVVACL